jgi:hypothetical protein
MIFMKGWYAYLVNDSDFLMKMRGNCFKAFGTIDGEMKNFVVAYAFVKEVPSVSVVKIEMVRKACA